MDGSEEINCAAVIGMAFFGCYVIAGVWIGATDFFVLSSRSMDLLEIRWYEYKFSWKVSRMDSEDFGDMTCISNYPLIRLDNGLDAEIKGDDIYNCFTEDGILYITNSSNQSVNTTKCYFEGNGLIRKGGIPRRSSTSEDLAVCKLGYLSTKKDSAAPNITNRSCTYLSSNSRGSFYTNFDTAKRIESEGIAACIVEVSTGVTIFLFCGWCARIFSHLFIISLCPEKKSKCTFLACAVVLMYEASVLFVSVRLPFLYRATNLQLTPAYIAMLVGNGITFVITVTASICVILTTQCRIGKKVQKKTARVWKQHPLTPATSRAMILDIHLLTDIPSANLEENNEVRNLTLSLWNSNRVGIGRDARGLHHRNIEIIDVRKMDTSLSRLYVLNRQNLQRYATCLPDEEIKLDYKDDDSVIWTRKELTDAHENSVLNGLVNYSINEVYLFHGTKTANISSIEQNGFDVKECKSNFVGRGSYFAESPVKADQYTDKSSNECTMILARVLLGKTIVLKDNIHMGTSCKPPCPNCLNTNCKKRHRKKRRPFDSVVLDKPSGLFREFVVYENGMAHPDYLITYKRVQ